MRIGAGPDRGGEGFPARRTGDLGISTSPSPALSLHCIGCIPHPRARPLWCRLLIPSHPPSPKASPLPRCTSRTPPLPHLKAPPGEVV